MRDTAVMLMVGLLIGGGCASRPSSLPRPEQRSTSTPRQTTGAAAHHTGRSLSGEPLVIGETFTINSAVLGEIRRVNVLVPTVYGEPLNSPLPVLYMLDGGVHEDFLHIAGLVQVLVSNGGMRPFMLVGIENTARRRDMTGPTTNDEDRKIAPVVGGSAAFRRFIREELMPAVRTRYETADESAILGESLAGLFVVETLFLEPDLFSTYIAVDPSLWWSGGALVNSAETNIQAFRGDHKSLLLAWGRDAELAEATARLARTVEAHRESGVRCHLAPFPEETHATIYHPAALHALRTVLGPEPARAK